MQRSRDLPVFHYEEKTMITAQEAEAIYAKLKEWAKQYNIVIWAPKAPTSSRRELERND